MRKYHVYIMASQRNGTLYIGITGNIKQRVQQHKDHALAGFTDAHNVTHLVWLEEFQDVNDALLAEKRLKTWKRKWKLRLIEEKNPDWLDLAEDEGFKYL